ncbi:hypothetical protein COCMIDRAFT_29758 [Bipolaris oryzae ATCC 44560]|uniref:Uncharacterized protein n=1 Tax=Bipolaris oryzae ATCC 44560 TaxID=930090 RepID=W6YPZ8_COCMI|nr:uncharacterized protein COCMIDRAFT_29758 [Bipolaris oryzae ATCC 44560]EUC41472.1 hypothetical protein COCMIDRAFT_29758 [Bipolaris oryzae ATCC 44560]
MALTREFSASLRQLDIACRTIPKQAAHLSMFIREPTWPGDASKPSSAERLPAGLKATVFSRVIVGLSINRSLAELGGSAIRVTCQKITGFSAAHHGLNWGKWNCHLHLKRDHRERLKILIQDAYVVVDGYRLGVMEQHGFGRNAMFEEIRRHGRGRGIIHVRENRYGRNAVEGGSKLAMLAAVFPWASAKSWAQTSPPHLCFPTLTFAQVPRDLLSRYMLSFVAPRPEVSIALVDILARNRSF